MSITEIYNSATNPETGEIDYSAVSGQFFMRQLLTNPDFHGKIAERWQATNLCKEIAGQLALDEAGISLPSSAETAPVDVLQSAA